MLLSRMPTRDMCRVRGMGVAGEGQDVHVFAQELQPLLMGHPEALFFVHN